MRDLALAHTSAERQLVTTDPVPKKQRLLIIDPDLNYSRDLANGFEQRGLIPEVATTAVDALEMAESRKPQFVVMELKLGKVNGGSLIPRLIQISSGCRIVVVTDHGSLQLATWAVKAGAQDMLVKPADHELIYQALTANTTQHIMPGKCANPYNVRRNYIFYLLNKNNYNITHTAKHLRITRRSLQRILAQERNKRSVAPTQETQRQGLSIDHHKRLFVR